VRTVLIEALLVGTIGALIALVANQASPRGLALTRDYFRISESRAAATNSSNTASTNLSGFDTNALIQSLKAKGLQPIGINEAKGIFQDPRFQQSLFLFIDARDDKHYQEGHVPGAFQLDYYKPETHLQLVIPMVQIAEKVVVYCNGGNCEDSELAASLLRDAGIPAEKLYVYLGGFADWEAQGMPVEIGVRSSGQMREATPKK
jgi:rhodanese-related sulfurtransferase